MSVAFLTRQTLDEAFRELGLRARTADKLVEIAVYGGAALVLTLPGRAATKDVDAVIDHDRAWLREAVSALAEENGWPLDWLNDSVKGWLSHRDADPEAKQLFKTYPSEDEPGLRVFLASPHYLFAMKCLAMRLAGADETQDRSDIEALSRQIGIVTAEQAFEIISQYYPLAKIPPKTYLGVEAIFPPTANSGRNRGPT
jgi:hypothetical protein